MQLLFQNWSISFLLDFNFTRTTLQNTKFTYLLWYLYDTDVVDYLITNSTFTLKIDKLQVNACRNDIDSDVRIFAYYSRHCVTFVIKRYSIASIVELVLWWKCATIFCTVS